MSEAGQSDKKAKPSGEDTRNRAGANNANGNTNTNSNTNGGPDMRESGDNTSAGRDSDLDRILNKAQGEWNKMGFK